MTAQTNKSIQKTSKVMVWLAIIILLAALTWVFDILGGRSAIQPMRVSGGQVIIPADLRGHYRAKGAINGIEVDFLLDTGATDVAVPEKLAARLGLVKGQQIQLHTANGMSSGYLTWIDSVSLGSIQVNNVRAVISAGISGETLLGMSFLRHLDWQHRNKELILVPQEK